MLRTLEQRGFPAKRVLPLSSPRSAGSSIVFRGEQLRVEHATAERFDGVDIALFSAGAAASRELAPLAAARGAVVIDNSSAWRMDPEVPLVVPEVNPEAVANRPKGIIANPNCSTIQMVVALKPIHALARLKHIVVSTYQAASGKGHAAVEELSLQMRALADAQTLRVAVFPAPL
ncbi:MAG TPA: aspartate-semialdehyde dehydrogenase, partial [Polyangiaceae bacterium]|nr:aspartate-semialdehyde dehydrogenase [Polyangiaceae bacterium]